MTTSPPPIACAAPGGGAPFAALLLELSTEFITLPPEHIDRAILDAQRRICECLGLDMCTLWQWPMPDGDAPRLTHIHRPPAGPPLPEPMSAADYFPWTMRQMRAGVLLRAASLAELPDEAARDRDVSAQFGIKSLVTIPLAVGSEPPFGAVTFNTMTAERAWSDEAVHELQLVAQVFANALARARGEDALRKRESRLAAGADLAGLAYYEIDYGHGTVWVDDRFREICGLPRDREAGLDAVTFWMDHLHPEDRARIMPLRQSLHDGTLELMSEEYRYRHPSRGERWIHHLARVTSRGDDGRALRTHGVFRDITERRRSEEALRQSYAEIERLRDKLQAETDYLKAEAKVSHEHHEITGKSAAIRTVLRLVEQVAPMPSSVLVCGETGTGKELVARAIHYLSPRQRQMMVKVNCAALPAGLVESELFGREKGAFTGAMARQAGRFEVADGSTLFLDEIGELSLDVQAKLLRVLEQGEFERLGSPRTIKVNVRLIAATNRDLTEEIKRGRFREDLYYRLSVFPIRVPPLRERSEDIPLLVWSFLEEFSSLMGKKIIQVPRRTMEALQRQRWPGNVRELRNVIERGAIVTTGDTLRVPMIEDDVALVAPPLPTTLADAERVHIVRVLDEAGWHVKGPKGAAAVLGLKPATLYSRMKKLGIALRR